MFFMEQTRYSRLMMLFQKMKREASGLPLSSLRLTTYCADQIVFQGAVGRYLVFGATLTAGALAWVVL